MLLTGVKPDDDDADAGLLAVIGSTLIGATRRCYRTHFVANLRAVTPRSRWL
jgi:transposase-like protein